MSNISQMLEEFNNIEIIRKTISKLTQPEVFVMVWYKDLERALSHYLTTPSKITFIIPDYYKYQSEIESLDKRIIPIESITKKQDIVVYASPSTTPWKGESLYRLLYLCHENHFSTYIDKEAISLLWKKPTISDFFDKHISAINVIYTALNDENSKNTYLRAIKAICTGDSGYLNLSNYQQYFHPKCKAEYGEHIIEGGIDNGVTTKKFADLCGDNGYVVAFEPLARAFIESKENCKNYTNIIFENFALSSSEDIFYIEDKGGGSRISKDNTRGNLIHSIDIDTYTKNHNNISCSLIKLDIEGSEMACLTGAINTIKKYRPKLQISLYHNPSDYIDIPLFIMQHCKNYDFFVGHHSFWFNETILYATPHELIVG